MRTLKTHALIWLFCLMLPMQAVLAAMPSACCMPGDEMVMSHASADTDDDSCPMHGAMDQAASGHHQDEVCQCGCDLLSGALPSLADSGRMPMVAAVPASMPFTLKAFQPETPQRPPKA